MNKNREERDVRNWNRREREKRPIAENRSLWSFPYPNWMRRPQIFSWVLLWKWTGEKKSFLLFLAGRPYVLLFNGAFLQNNSSNVSLYGTCSAAIMLSFPSFISAQCVLVILSPLYYYFGLHTSVCLSVRPSYIPWVWRELKYSSKEEQTEKQAAGFT